MHLTYIHFKVTPCLFFFYIDSKHIIFLLLVIFIVLTPLRGDALCLLLKYLRKIKKSFTGGHLGYVQAVWEQCSLISRAREVWYRVYVSNMYVTISSPYNLTRL